MKEIEELKNEIKTLKLSVQNRDEVIVQNRNLQTELRNAEIKIATLNEKIKKLEELPFFPYPMNSGGRKDYGEFYLISHAWFSCMLETKQIGIIEVEWKKGGRCIYLGVGSGIANPNMFDYDVKKIALFGQKIKDSRGM